MRSTRWSSPSRGTVVILCIVALTATFLGIGLDVLHQVSRGRVGAAMTYYKAAQALHRGSDPYTTVHNAYPYVYPPFYAWCTIPLTRLSPTASARAMAAIDGGAILLSIVAASYAMLARFARRVTWDGVMVAAVLATLIAVVPIHSEWRGLETNSILLLSFSLALVWLDRRPVLAGLALAVSIVIKYLPLVAIPYLLLRRRYAAAAAALVGSVALALLPAVSVGGATNLRYLREAVGGLTRLAPADERPADSSEARINSTDALSSLSVSSAMTRIAGALALPKSAAAAMLAVLGLGTVVGVVLASRARGVGVFNWPTALFQNAEPYRRIVGVEWAAMVCFLLVFSPNTQNRNLVLAILPAAAVAADVCTAGAGPRRRFSALIGIAMFVGLLLPIAAMGKPLTVVWLWTGAPCWILWLTSLVWTRIAMAPADARDASSLLDAPRLAIASHDHRALSAPRDPALTNPT